MIIREATLQDFDFILRGINLNAIYEHFLNPIFSPTWMFQEEEQLEIKDIITRPNSLTFIYEEDSEALGMIMGHTIIEEGVTTLLMAKIKYLYVNNQHRNKGIENELVNAFATKAKEYGADRIILDTVSDNEEVIKLFEEKGFKQYLSSFVLDL